VRPVWSRVVLIAMLAAAAVSVLTVSCGPLVRAVLRPTEPPASFAGARVSELPPGSVRGVAEGLEVPWGLAFLPDGGMLVTERPGRLVQFPPPLPADGPPHPRSAGRAWQIAGVRAAGEGGLMGIALHPRFVENGWVYLMLTGESGDGAGENRVERYRLTEDGPVERTVIIGGITAGRNHNGGAIAFGPDGHLYIATGDAGQASLAQDSTSPAGSILRVTEAGDVAQGNPLGTAAWSWGHRNVQGLAWDDRGRLWATEHGRSGLRSGLDELNRIEPGRNYGWPTIEGDQTSPGLQPPVLHSGPDYTWAPAGAAWLAGRLFFGGLRGEALYEAANPGAGEDRDIRLRAHLYGEFGRIRGVTAGPDGALYFTTSNRDGRGRTREGDDRIVRADPSALR
jgi:glucose/arabinose dehydrogenase